MRRYLKSKNDGHPTTLNPDLSAWPHPLHLLTISHINKSAQARRAEAEVQDGGAFIGCACADVLRLCCIICVFRFSGRVEEDHLV